MVAEIRSCCGKNEEYRQLEETIEDGESPQHPSRLLNASSRKISLTCQTLPSPPSRSTQPAACGMLEPKRTSGGRLRSPAPSPIPSPVASPIPSPSRNRFVVCRVSEALVRSTESSASSSPITPPSLGSSPSFFSSASGGSSRFRVSVVESTNTGHSTSPKSVVASTNSGSVTIGFNVEVHAADSDDSDSAAKTAVETAGDNTAASVDKFSVSPATTRETPPNEETRFAGGREIEAQAAADGAAVATEIENECGAAAGVQKERSVQSSVRTLQSEGNEDIATIRGDESDVTTDFVSVATIGRDTDEVIGDHRTVYTSTKELQVPAYPNEATSSAKINIIGDKVWSNARKPLADDISECRAKREATSEELSTCILDSSVGAVSETSSARLPHSQEPSSTSIQKHKSSLDKLLSLFQHPGQLFSDTSSVAAETKSSPQENGVMAMGDGHWMTLLQQYLKEGRAKLGTDSSWFLEHNSPPKSRSMKLNVSQLQNLTGMFTSFKLEPYSNFVVEQGTKLFSPAKNQDANIREKDSDRSNMVARIDEEDSFSREGNSVARNDRQNFERRLDQAARSDDENSVGQKRDPVTRSSENQNDLDDKETSRAANTEVEDFFGPVTRNDAELISHENNQVLIKQGNLFDEMKNEIVAIEARNVHEEERRDAESADEQVRARAENQVVQDDEDRRGDNVACNDERDWEATPSAGNSGTLRDPIARDDEEDSADVRDACVAEEESARSADELQRTKSDFSDQPLSESVQSKDNLVDNLVLDDCPATDAVVSPSTVLPSPSRSVARPTVTLTDIAEYSTLGLSKIDSTGCNSKRDSKHTERNDAECLERDEISGNDSAKCFERDDAAGEADASTARKTCDKITTDSINQTSNSSFATCSVAHDREAVDNVSTAKYTSTSATTDDSVDAIELPSTFLPMDDAEALLSASSGNVGARDHLNTKVTSSARCLADQRDFTQREPGENLAEVVSDNVCRDLAHCRSTNVNIKVEQRESGETASPGSRTAPGEDPERQFMPNKISVYQNILKDGTDTKDSSEDAVEGGKQIDPTIHLTPYKTSATKADRSDAEELIFCMTDISADGASADDELSPSVASENSSNHVANIAEPCFELPASGTTATSATTQLIENPEGVHSQDSEIEEEIDAAGTTDAPPMPPPRGSLQESVDSGIESECSSICIRMDSSAEWKVEVLPRKFSRNDNGIHERSDGDARNDSEAEDNNKFEEFASDFLARNTRLDGDRSVSSSIAHSYLSSVKCPVVNTARSVAATASNAPLGIEVTADEICPATPIIAHSPAAVHSTR